MDRFTAEQIREYNDAFMLFDSDGSGDIHVSELRDMLKTIGFNPTDEVLECMTIAIDENEDGMVRFDEFINLIDGLETYEKNEKESKEAFNAFDFNGEGFIDSIDIMEALKCVLESRPPKELDGIVRFYQLVPSRRIEFKEFQNMVMTWCHSLKSKAKWEQVEELKEKPENPFLYSPNKWTH